MNLTVGTTAVSLGLDSQSTPVIQNLGPGVVYMDNTEDVTTATGLRLAVGDTYEFFRDLNQAGGEIFLVSDTAGTDVRIMVVG